MIEVGFYRQENVFFFHCYLLPFSSGIYLYNWQLGIFEKFKQHGFCFPVGN